MRLFRLLFVAFFIIGTGLLLSQSGSYKSFETERLFQEDFTSKLKDDKILNQSKSLVGDIIIPEFYYVGPGDVLLVHNFTTNALEQYVMVTPELTVMLPRIGELSVKGLSLKEVKPLIIKAIKDRNENAIVSVSLQQPRNVVVRVTGNVKIPGTYTFPSSMRVSTVLNLVNQMKKESISMAETDNYFIQQNENFRNQVFNNSGLPLNMPYSQRNVKLINKNGTSRTVDIEEAAATGDINLDPYIREGDEIFVPSDPKTYPEISISGEVIKPAKIPFRKGDNVEKLLKFGRGFTENADLDNVYHISAEGQKTKLTINPDLSVVNGNHPLNPGGMIIVGAYRQEVAEPATISILGYVRSPGNYPIINNQTKLKEAIELAGGFVDKAYLPLAYILRNNKEFYNDRTTRWNYMNSFQYSDLTLEDTTRFIMAIELKKPVVSCDFVKLFDEKAESYNITLQDGDMIVIPENPGSVYVFGQVTNPGFVAYSKDKKPDWYIEKAGGYAVKAEKSRTRVIDGRTKVWKKMEDEKLIVNAGDEIYVPKPADLPPGIELQTYAVLASTITAVIVLINLIIGLIK